MHRLLLYTILPLTAAEPALLLVSYNDDLHSAQQLILANARINEANDLGATPLWAACQNGSVDMVRLLLEAGANPNVALLSGETPLMVAARAGKTEIIRQLLARRADPNKTATRRQTALMWAVAQKHPEVAKLLIANGANIHARSEACSEVMAVPPHGYRPYNKAIPHGNDTALLLAARVGDFESAKLLIAAGANGNDADAWGVSATMYAAHSGYPEIVGLLLANKADPNAAAAGFTALHIAILRRDEAMAVALLAKGANPNTPLTTWTPTRRSSKDLHFPPALVGSSPFWLAARYQLPVVMRQLIKQGANPKFIHHAHTVTDGLFEKRTQSSTALQAALAKSGERESLVLETVKAAVELGVDRSGALPAAKAHGYASVIKYLEETQ